MLTRTNRRHFLRGAGVSIALPVMESILPRAGAATGRDGGNPVKRVVTLSNNYGAYHKTFFPRERGTDYEMPPTLKGLEKHRKDFTVFSNLDHGISGGHACVPTFLSGVMPYLAANFPEGNISLDLRAMIELIALAIQTDSTRAITLSSEFVNGDFGLSGGYHGFSHHGEHKTYPEEKGKRLPAANLLLSMLQNFGLEIDRFGTSTGTLRGLEWKA